MSRGGGGSWGRGSLGNGALGWGLDSGMLRDSPEVLLSCKAGSGLLSKSRLLSKSSSRVLSRSGEPLAELPGSKG